MKNLLTPSVIVPLLTLFFAGILHAEKIEIAGYSFSSPEKWVSSIPTSKMRKAQFSIPVENGKNAEVAFFHFGGGGSGGVKANIDRWMGQFE